MDEIPENLDAKFDVVVAVDWFKLNEYLQNFYGGDCHILIEANNDSYFYVQPVVPVSANDRETVLREYAEEDLPHWNLHYMISVAVEDGHLPHCNYLVSLSW